MRTTLNFDAQLLNTVKRLAAARSVMLGDIVSEFANKDLQAERRTQCRTAVKRKSGFPIFKSVADPPMIGLEDVNRDEVCRRGALAGCRVKPLNTQLPI